METLVCYSKSREDVSIYRKDILIMHFVLLFKIREGGHDFYGLFGQTRGRKGITFEGIVGRDVRILTRGEAYAPINLSL